MGIEKKLAGFLAERHQGNFFRKLSLPNHKIDFCSNDYLGFARSADLKQLIVQKSKTISGIGSTGSRLITGNSFLAEAIENQIAAFHHAPAALLFNSGYDANIGLLASLAYRGDVTIIYDQLVHASMRDGIRLSRAPAFAFQHNDLEDLEAQLKKAKGTIIIAVESIYSMDGDCVPLTAMVNLAEKYGADIIVDEAHSTGVLGDQGKGLVVEKGLEDRIFARVHTFGKALGVHGAAIVGSAVLKDYLINFARSFIYTTALSNHALCSIQAAYELLLTTTAIQQLHRNIAFFKNNINGKLTQHLMPSDSPVQSLVIAGNAAVKTVANRLQAKGLDARAILYPSVPKGAERIRICIHAFNTEAELSLLCNVVKM